MMKAIAIIVFGLLLLTGCGATLTVEEAIGDQYQQLNVGMSKKMVRQKFMPVIEDADPTIITCSSYNYYPNFEAEILSSKDNSTHLVFTEVKYKGGCATDMGSFHSIHNTFASAKKAVDTMKNIVELNKEKKKVELLAMINEAKSTCKELGFKEDSDKFADCALKLYTQKIDQTVKQK